MAAATTTDQFLELLRKSGLVESNRLDAFLGTLGEKVREQPRPLADALVRQGMLTPFQAGQLLSGKWRGFFIAGGKYKLLQLLGVGGMGRVYLCEHLRMRRLVALKVLPDDQTKDPSSVERFNREAQAAAALNHPNIVRAYDIDQDGPMHFLVMEFVDGTSLQDIVKKHGPLEINRACHYVSQAAVGLQHAHEAGWVHRDIKPGNLLLDRNGTVKILDMGLARFFDTPDNEKLTQQFDSKAVLGTADYLAPEQAVNSSEVDIRADIYSLGATLYYLLTGKAPFEDGSVAQKLLAHQTQEPQSASSIRADMPKQLSSVLKKMMAKKPVHRFQTPQAIVEALQPWTETPIELPADEEMTRLCPALMGLVSTPGVGGPPSGNLGPMSGRIRKPLSNTRSSSYLLRKGVPSELTKWAKQRPGLLIGVVIGVVISFCVLVIAVTRPWSGNQTASTTPPSVAPDKVPVEQVVNSVKPTWTPTQVKAPVAPSKETIFVSRSPQPAVTGRSRVFPSLNEVMALIAPGMRIVILDDAVQFNLVLDNPERHSNVVFETMSGQTVTWTPTPESGSSPVIEVRGVPNVKLKGFTIRGGDRTAALVRVHGSCQGLRLEDMQLSDFPEIGMELSGCDPAADSPISVQKTRFVTVKDYLGANRDRAADIRSAAMVVSVAGGAMPGGPALLVHDCRFEGLYHSAVEITGPISAEFYRNRFLTLRDDERPDKVKSCEAFLWRPGQAAGAPKLQLVSNTVARFPTFIRVEKLPAAMEASIDLRSNLMVGGSMWATGPGKTDDPAAIGTFKAAGNVAKPRTCTLGYDIPKKYVEIKGFNWSLDDQHFLRYPRRIPSEDRINELANAGADGEPAGYPPLD